MKRVLTLILIGLLIAFQSCKTEPDGIIEVLTPQEVYDAVFTGDNNVQLIDVRTEEEYGVSHLKNAQNICVTNKDFEEKVKTLDKDEPVYVYCRSGGRSADAAKILKDMGFTKVYDLQGGITNWEEKNFETQK